MVETGRTPPRHLEYMPLDEMPDALVNPKRHDQEGIADSMGEFAFMDPIVLDERTGRLVAGHGRRDTLRWMRENQRPAPEGITVREDGAWLAPVVRGWASRDDDHAHAAGIAINRQPERGGWDETELGTVLRQLESSDPALTFAAGFTVDDIDDLVAELDEQFRTSPGPADADRDGEDDGWDGDTDGNVRQDKSIYDLRDAYALSDQRQVSLMYAGDQYVWMVDKLRELAGRFGVDSNSDVVLRLVEQAVGDEAPPLVD